MAFEMEFQYKKAIEENLEDAPDLEAKTVFEYLLHGTECGLQESHLRTFQRRVKEWRHIMARNLVYFSLDLNSTGENIVPVGVKKFSD